MSPEASTQQESVNNTVINFVSENLEGSYIQQSQISSEKSDETRVAPNPFSGAGEAELGERRDHGDVEGGLVLSTPSTSEVLAVIEASQLNRRKSVKDLVTDFSSCVSNASSSEGEGLGE